MARVVVDVMLKPEILDPQGRAVQGAMSRLGLQVNSVRQGKRFEIEIAGEIDEALEEQLDELAGSLLSNPVIEDYTIYEEAEEAGGCCQDGCACAADEAEASAAAELLQIAPAPSAEASV